MKISSMNTEQFIEFISVASEPLSNILTNPKVLSMFTPDSDTNNISKSEYGVQFMMTLISTIPLLLQEHKQDLYIVIAKLDNKTIEEISKQNILITIKIVKEMLSDKDFFNFLFSTTNTVEIT